MGIGKIQYTLKRTGEGQMCRTQIRGQFIPCLQADPEKTTDQGT